MNLIISFKGMETDEKIKHKLTQKMESLEHLLAQGAKVDVTLREYDNKKVADAKIDSGKDHFFGKVHSYDFDQTVELLKDKLKTQILKSKN